MSKPLKLAHRKDIKMIDYINITKSLHGKDKPFLEYCQQDAVYSSGWKKYLIQGCEELYLWYNPNINMLRLEGSIMYYIQGHNFTYNRQNFNKGINYLNSILEVDLWDSEVKSFEFGVIIKVEKKPKEYIKNHEVAPKEKLLMNENSKDKGNFRWFESKSVTLKLYDAGRNIKFKQGKSRKAIIEEAGWNPNDNFLKFEVKYKKPEILIERGKLVLSDLVSPEYNDMFKGDLYLQYQRLLPVKSIEFPQNKSNLSTPDILVLDISEDLINRGFTISSIQKRLYDRINSIPNEVLSKSDKDSRKRQIKLSLNKLKQSDTSKWDLSSKIADALLLL